MRSIIAPPPVEPVAVAPAPSFSVIIAAYQAAATIAEAIESALAQTAPPHEIVVCDDGSTDGIERTLEPYRDRIVFLRQPNGGEGAAKNSAARAATGAVRRHRYRHRPLRLPQRRLHRHDAGERTGRTA